MPPSSAISGPRSRWDARTLTIEYVEFWEKKIAHLKSRMQRIGSENLQGIREDLDLYVKIRNTLARITDILRDMNALTLEEHQRSNFQELRRALEAR